MQSVLIDETEELRVNAVLCGQTLDEFTHYLEAREVREVAEALARVSEGLIQQRFNQASSARSNLYSVWATEEYKEFLEFCDDIKKFYEDAANRGNAILIKIV